MPRDFNADFQSTIALGRTREIVATVLPSAVDLLGNCQGTQPDAKSHEDHARCERVSAKHP